MPVIVSAREFGRARGGLEARGPFSTEAGERGAESPESIAPDRHAAAQFVAGLARAEAAIADAERHPGIFVTVEDPLASLVQTFLAERAEETGQTVALSTGGEEARMDERNRLDWVRHAYQWISSLSVVPWVEPADRPDELGKSFRLALLGDWGTGLYGAPRCAASIQAAGRDYQLILHLGDVYYSGTHREVKQRFLEFWPKIDGVLNRAINGNHEMYSGGHGYFHELLPQFGQASSCFALENGDWLLLGLDSSYKTTLRELFYPPENDFHDAQLAWLFRQVERAEKAKAKKKIVLFTHHQPFSYFERQGPKLAEKLGKLLNSGQLFAWYWGHEHRCILYDRHPEWGFYGRCVGHGGFPYFRDEVARFPDPSLSRTEFRRMTESTAGWRYLPGRVRDEKIPNPVPLGHVLDGSNQDIPGYETEYGPNGYMSLTFSGEDLIETVHDARGFILYEQPLK